VAPTRRDDGKKWITLICGDESRRILARPGDTLLKTLRAGGAGIESPCGGNGTCGKCRVERETSGRWETVLACRETVRGGETLRLPGRAPRMRIAGVPGPAREKEDGGEAAPTPAGAVLGAAVDVGTTTIAAGLYDLHSGACLCRAGAPNCQRVYGADVLSRIRACGEEGLDALVVPLRRQIGDLVADCCRRAGARPEQITRFAVAGNTVMEHFVAGLSPASIGEAPFAPLSLFGREVPAARLGLASAPGASVYLAPAVSGYVGGDVTAGLLAAGGAGDYLYLDLGTNGEIALQARGRLLCCAAAAGPAFEGAGISMGMAGMTGAVDHVSLAPGGGLACTVIGGGAPAGVCGSGLVDAAAVLLGLGVVDGTGRMLPPDELPAGAPVKTELRGGEAVCRLCGPAALTAGDIRALQLAKGAVRAGAEVLLQKAGVRADDLDTVYLAGGFGNFIAARSAARIGLLPPGAGARAQGLGNAAAQGAARMLFSESARAQAREIARRCEYVELSDDPSFTDAFLEAMAFGEDSD
jgi:uncharacterized 2Fe-2S/4Fe-4S cluster protein (DUF4445 family)